MSKTWFVTGTDTEVGKTAVSCALLEARRGEGCARRRSNRWRPVVMTRAAMRMPCS